MKKRILSVLGILGILGTLSTLSVVSWKAHAQLPEEAFHPQALQDLCPRVQSPQNREPAVLYDHAWRTMDAYHCAWRISESLEARSTRLAEAEKRLQEELEADQAREASTRAC